MHMFTCFILKSELSLMEVLVSASCYYSACLNLLSGAQDILPVLVEAAQFSLTITLSQGSQNAEMCQASARTVP